MTAIVVYTSLPKNLKFGNLGKRNFELDKSEVCNKNNSGRTLKGIRGMRIDPSINYNNKLFVHVNNNFQ